MKGGVGGKGIEKAERCDEGGVDAGEGFEGVGLEKEEIFDETVGMEGRDEEQEKLGEAIFGRHP